MLTQSPVYEAGYRSCADLLEAELLKHLPDEGLRILTAHINRWLSSTEVPPSLTDAKIAALFKKGDFKNTENYRPISLLNTIYKLQARVLKDKIEDGIEQELQPTQYAFRKKRSTLQAIHCIRRLMDKAERAGESLGIVLLDWEKAFDKITRSSLLHTLRRYNVHEHLITLVASLYNKTDFCVKFRNRTSDQKTQHTGIRQGCPLSPYLFVIVMSAMWDDINHQLGYDTLDHYQRRTMQDDVHFNEILYADDTLIFTPRRGN